MYKRGKCMKKEIYKNGYLFINHKEYTKERAIRSCSIRVLLLKYYSKSFFKNIWNLFLDNRGVKKAIIICF